MEKKLYSQAKELLYQEYELNAQAVKDSFYYTSYVDEKLRHSLQVSGAGNGILRREACFQNRSEIFLDLVQATILLHDIYRFAELKTLHQTGQEVDHGVMGAEFLKKTSSFNNLKITLPVKHHGHMIADFYQDPEYLEIKDEDLKKDIESILFAVRDADKIANWRMLTNEYDATKLVWVPYPDDESPLQGHISTEVWGYFSRQEIVPYQLLNTNAEMVLSVLCWLFDINYTASIKYCQTLDLFAGFYKLFMRLGVSGDYINDIKSISHKYVLERFNIDIKDI